MPVVGEKEVRMKAGTRPSRLAWVQARSALDRIEELIGNVRFGLQPIASGGGTDRLTDLRVSPPPTFSPASLTPPCSMARSISLSTAPRIFPTSFRKVVLAGSGCRAAKSRAMLLSCPSARSKIGVC